jgi:dynein heavy chain
MKKKEFIITQNALSAKTLRDIEDRILTSLSKHAKIDMILEDDQVINILAESKVTTDDINVRQKESAKEEKNINKIREDFRPVAFRAQTLFFSIVDLALIDPMYQYSLQWFANLYAGSIDNS